VLVVAPKAVHPNWAYDEMPTHMWDEVTYDTLVWQSKKVKNKGFKEEFESLLESDNLAVVTINYEALLSKTSSDMIEKFLKERKVMIVCDESHRIKTPSAKTTKKILKFAKLAECRWILTGTSITNSPFDIYSQFKFVDPAILDQSSFFAFKNRYGIFVQEYGANGKYSKLEEYRNLDKLSTIIQSHSSRVLKADVLDLPEKIYAPPRYFELDPKCAKLYKEMKEELIIELDDAEISAPLAITMLSKLQQIACGFVFDEHGNSIEISRARVHTMLEDLPEDDKCIIFAKYKQDHKMISEELEKLGVDFVSYTGSTSDEDREIAKKRFQTDPTCRVFLGNPAACREGITLHAANVVLNYNRSFNYTDNKQAEDRAHRIGQKADVIYIDYIAKGTIDEAIVHNLRDKNAMAAMMNGDNIRKWI
jgi:SNF2 family DNA or RNA helicase